MHLCMEGRQRGVFYWRHFFAFLSGLHLFLQCSVEKPVETKTKGIWKCSVHPVLQYITSNMSACFYGCTYGPSSWLPWWWKHFSCGQKRPSGAEKWHCYNRMSPNTFLWPLRADLKQCSKFMSAGSNLFSFLKEKHTAWHASWKAASKLKPQPAKQKSRPQHPIRHLDEARSHTETIFPPGLWVTDEVLHTSVDPPRPLSDCGVH